MRGGTCVIYVSALFVGAPSRWGLRFRVQRTKVCYLSLKVESLRYGGSTLTIVLDIYAVEVK